MLDPERVNMYTDSDNSDQDQKSKRKRRKRRDGKRKGADSISGQSDISESNNDDNMSEQGKPT